MVKFVGMSDLSVLSLPWPCVYLNIHCVLCYILSLSSASHMIYSICSLVLRESAKRRLKLRRSSRLLPKSSKSTNQVKVNKGPEAKFPQLLMMSKRDCEGNASKLQTKTSDQYIQHPLPKTKDTKNQTPQLDVIQSQFRDRKSPPHRLVANGKHKEEFDAKPSTTNHRSSNFNLNTNKCHMYPLKLASITSSEATERADHAYPELYEQFNKLRLISPISDV